MRRTATILLVFTAYSAILAAEPVCISLAESPVPGLSVRIETHLAREYDCTVISRSRVVSASFEQSIERMRMLCEKAKPIDTVLAADVCAWATAWDESLSHTGRHPVNGIRELSYAVTDLSQPPDAAPAIKTEKVPAHSDYERLLAKHIAEALHIQPKTGETRSVSKTGTFAVLPLIRLEDYLPYKVNRNPDDTICQLMESALQTHLPDGAAILSRDSIHEILAEHNLAGLIERDGNALRAIVHLLPARFLICGTVTRRIYNPKELRLDLHVIESCNNALLAAWEGRCANEQALPELAAGGIRELLAMPWRDTEKLRPATASERTREARFMIARSCYATAWSLAGDQPKLYQPIFSGLLSRVSQYSRWMLPLPENPDAFRNLVVREACLMIEDLLKRQDPPASLGCPPPDLIRAEMRFWLGEYAEAEKICRAYLLDPKRKQADRAAIILAWALCKQKRYDESQSLLRQTVAGKKNMWTYRVLDGSRDIPWGNALNQELAAQTGDWSDVYREVKARMLGADLYSNEDMAIYLREVEKQEGAEMAIAELSALLTSHPHLLSRKAVLDKRKINLTVRCSYLGVIPAYITRARCYESIGDKQKALDDYALFLRIMRYFGYDPDPKKWHCVKLAPFLSLIPKAEEGVRRLGAEGFEAKDEWRSMAEVRPFPQDAVIYVVPVGTCDKNMLALFVKYTTEFLGARVEMLAGIPSPGIKQTAGRGGSPEYNGKELVDAVLKQIEVPDDVIQLVLATSEVFRIHGNSVCISGSFDEGATLLLSLKDRAFTTGHQMRDAVLFGLHYRYAPRYTGRFSDSTSVRLFLKDTEYCCSPCIFGGDMQAKSGEANGICTSCQEAYAKVDFDALKRGTIATLKRQGVKIVPARITAGNRAPRGS
jgi:tetratricopeptide (TPR) repeat protein